jgi:transposase-like protein
MPRTARKYTTNLKIQVVLEALEGGKSPTPAAS